MAEARRYPGRLRERLRSGHRRGSNLGRMVTIGQATRRPPVAGAFMAIQGPGPKIWPASVSGMPVIVAIQ